jgi:hypothetical protein
LLKSYSKIKSSVWNRQGKRNYNTLRGLMTLLNP